MKISDAIRLLKDFRRERGDIDVLVYRTRWILGEPETDFLPASIRLGEVGKTGTRVAVVKIEPEAM